MTEYIVKTTYIYHVIKVRSDDSYIPTTKNIIYTGDEQDSKEILLEKVAKSQDDELYALIREERIMKVIARQHGIITN